MKVDAATFCSTQTRRGIDAAVDESERQIRIAKREFGKQYNPDSYSIFNQFGSASTPELPINVISTALAIMKKVNDIPCSAQQHADIEKAIQETPAWVRPVFYGGLFLLAVAIGLAVVFALPLSSAAPPSAPSAPKPNEERRTSTLMDKFKALPANIAQSAASMKQKTMSYMKSHKPSMGFLFPKAAATRPLSVAPQPKQQRLSQQLALPAPRVASPSGSFGFSQSRSFAPASSSASLPPAPVSFAASPAPVSYPDALPPARASYPDALPSARASYPDALPSARASYPDALPPAPAPASFPAASTPPFDARTPSISSPGDMEDDLSFMSSASARTLDDTDFM